MTKEFELSLGTSEIGTGWTASVKPVKPFGSTVPGSTAYHEAVHAVAAILTGSHVREATNIAGDGYLGKTEIDGFNAIAFAAAHAKGCGGTGHDLAVLRILGHDPSSLAWAARNVLSGHDDEIYAVSSLIEERGRISGFEAKEAMKKASDPEADVELISPNGQSYHFTSKIRGNPQYYIPVRIPYTLQS